MVIDSELHNNVSPDTVQQAVTSLDKYILEHYGKPKKRTLRERQITVFEDLRDTLSGGQTEGYITLPAGVGKTVLFTEAVEAFNEDGNLETLVVVPTRILARQTKERFQQFAPDIEVGMLYSDEHDLTKTVTITTYSSLVRRVQDGTLDPESYRVLVLDEVHRSLSQKRIQAISRFTEAIKIGFTATPTFSEDRQVANLLNTEIHKMTLREAVEGDLLSPFSAIIAQTDVDLSTVSIKSNGDYDERELEDAINIATRNQAAVDLYQKLFPGKTTVAYCNSIKHAQDLAKFFTRSGVPAAFISGEQNKAEQEELLKKFHEGTIQVLCNADILIEGFDEPRASVCLNLKPTRSVVVAQQRAGRVLRLDPDNHNKHAVVVDFLDKTQDPRKLPVTFAEVAEAAIILTKSDNSENGGGGTKGPGGGIDFPPLDEIEISGLKVTVDPKEVMRIVKDLRESRPEKVPLFNPDIEINVGVDSLLNLFKTSLYPLRATLDLVFAKLEDEYRVQRLQRVTERGRLISALSKDNFPKFIELMKQQDIILKRSLPKYEPEEEFSPTSHNLTKLFHSRHKSTRPAAIEVMQEIERNYPGSTALRYSGTQKVRIIPTSLLPLFILLMRERGFRQADSETIQKNGNSEKEFALLRENLDSIFKGGSRRLNPIINQVLLELEQTNPGVILHRVTKRGARPYRAIPEYLKDKFIQLVEANGVRLQ